MDHTEAITDAAAGDIEDQLAADHYYAEQDECDDICMADPMACFH